MMTRKERKRLDAQNKSEKWYKFSFFSDLAVIAVQIIMSLRKA